MGRWSRKYFTTGRKKETKKPKKRHSKNSIKEKEAKNGTKTTKNKLDKRILLERVEILKEHITDEIKENRETKISKLSEEIKYNVDNGVKYGR